MKQESESYLSGRERRFPTALNPKFWPRFWREEPVRIMASLIAFPMAMGVAAFFGPTVTAEGLVGIGLLMLGCVVVVLARRKRRRGRRIHGG